MEGGRSESLRSSARTDMCRSEVCSSPAPALPLDMPSQQLTKPMKPRLPRKLAASARINLNRYWHALEELMPMPLGHHTFDEADCNAINENLDNERRLAAMQLDDLPCKPSLLPPGPRATPMADISTSNIHQSGESSSNSLLFPKVPSGSLSFSKHFEDTTSLVTSPDISYNSNIEGILCSTSNEDAFTFPMVLDENTPPPTADCARR